MKLLKRLSVLALTAALTLSMAAPAMAAGSIEVTEDVSVSDDYDWTRFKGQNMTLNVYNWGEYISNGSDDSEDVVSDFEKLTGQKPITVREMFEDMENHLIGTRTSTDN